MILTLVPTLSLALLFPAAPGEELSRFEERVVAGGPDDSVTVRHLVLAGSQRAIGARLTALAQERYAWAPRQGIDPRRTAAQRRYFERNAPLFLERMRGVADAAGVALEDDALNLSGLGFGYGKPGCTVFYVPPSHTSSGRSVVSRNFDFTTGTMTGRIPGEDEVSICGEPYVLETHPDDGYASISVCSYDLLGGVVDGMNEEGLVIALLADDELTSRFEVRAARGPQAGFGVLQIGRHVLETCATVEEAQAALLEAKLYYTSIPCHYLVADRHGRSFVWENSVSMTEGFVFEGNDAPQVTTNFLYQLHDDLDDLPEDEHPSGSFARYRAVMERLGTARELDRDAVVAAARCVAAEFDPPPAPWAPGRTLWHALYHPEERRVEVDFYLGEDRGDEGVRRSPYLSFELTARRRTEVAGGD